MSDYPPPPGSGNPRGDDEAQQQYGQHQSAQHLYSQPGYVNDAGGPAYHPALQGAAPTGAGTQIGAQLVEWVILSVPATLVVVLSMIPMFSAIASVAATSSNQLTESQAAELFGAAFLSFGIAAVLSIAVGIFLWWWLAVKGKSIGYAIFGLRLVSADTGQPLGWGKIFLRFLVVYVVGVVTAGIGNLLFLLSPLFDSTSGWYQAWQDKMFGAVVINHKQGRDTYAGQ
jgi:uncharacterized RDD family membrane protein YckC